MSVRPLILRGPAHQDVEDAVEHYLREAGENVASGFVNALESAYRHIADHPATGSSRYAHALNLPSLRSWPVCRYPYIVFYREAETHIEIWRVLHAERDIPAIMKDPEG